VLVHAVLTTGSGRRIVATLFRHFFNAKTGAHNAAAIGRCIDSLMRC
jgi:hypothetical protein